MIAAKAKFISPRVQKDVALFEGLIALELKREFDNEEIPRERRFWGDVITSRRYHEFLHCTWATWDTYAFWIKVGSGAGCI
jgi:hypothetical protein